MIPHVILKFKFLPLFLDLKSWYNKVPQGGDSKYIFHDMLFSENFHFWRRRGKISHLKSEVLLRKIDFSFSRGGRREGVKVFISNVKPKFSMKGSLFNFVGGGGWVGVKLVTSNMNWYL